jgi:hypothetical protein
LDLQACIMGFSSVSYRLSPQSQTATNLSAIIPASVKLRLNC